MKTPSIYHALAAGLATAWLFAAAPVAAAPPENVAGTTWTVQANRAAIQLVIETQAGPGAPGQAVCRAIHGTIGIAPIHGWYCPATGRIHFKHNNLNSGVTVRVFTGNVSDDVVGQPLYMAGTMTVDNIGLGDLGEYNFSAVR